MEVKPTTKKTKKLVSKSSIMVSEEKVYLPVIDREELIYGKTSLKEETSPLQHKFGNFSGVLALLPNFIYKKGKFYFQMKNPYDMSYGLFLIKQIYSANYFFIKTDLPGLSKIQVHYELMKEEKEEGLLCRIYFENARDFGKKDFQGICKMIELTILNMNPTNTFELISYQDVYSADGKYPHIYEEFEEVKYPSKGYQKEEEVDYYENQENEKSNSEWINMSE